MVPKVRVSFWTVPSSAVVSKQATTNFLATSIPQQHGYRTCMASLLCDQHGCPQCRRLGVRCSQILPCVLPLAERDNERCLRTPRPNCWPARSTSINRPLRRRHARSLAIFILSGRPLAEG